jgi:hypothetical protein
MTGRAHQDRPTVNPLGDAPHDREPESAALNVAALHAAEEPIESMLRGKCIHTGSVIRNPNDDCLGFYVDVHANRGARRVPDRILQHVPHGITQIVGSNGGVRIGVGRQIDAPLGVQRPNQRDCLIDDARDMGCCFICRYGVEPRKLQHPFHQPLQTVMLHADVVHDTLRQVRIGQTAAFENADVTDSNRQRRPEFVTGVGEKCAQPILTARSASARSNRAIADATPAETSPKSGSSSAMVLPGSPRATSESCETMRPPERARARAQRILTAYARVAPTRTVPTKIVDAWARKRSRGSRSGTSKT